MFYNKISLLNSYFKFIYQILHTLDDGTSSVRMMKENEMEKTNVSNSLKKYRIESRTQPALVWHLFL